MSLVITPLQDIPLVKPGDHLADIIFRSVLDNQLVIQDGDIFVVTQKIVSKSEDRLVNLNKVIPSPTARELAAVTEKDPRLVEVILSESKEVVRAGRGVLIVEHRCGFICANAGVDHSNVQAPWGNPEDWVLLLPENPDRSAREIQLALEGYYQKHLGVLIIDSHGRAWRNGVVGVTVGISGIPAVVDLRGKDDIFGYKLRVSQVAAADELAAAASLVMGQVSERIPVVHVRGFPYPLRDSTLSELLRQRETDLFR